MFFFQILLRTGVGFRITGQKDSEAQYGMNTFNLKWPNILH